MYLSRVCSQCFVLQLCNKNLLACWHLDISLDLLSSNSSGRGELIILSFLWRHSRHFLDILEQGGIYMYVCIYIYI